MSVPPELRMEIALAATPEQVWEAIATGPGISAWFVPTTVDRERGTIRQDFGSGFVADGRVTVDDEGTRFGYGELRSGDSSDDGSHAFEFVVEARDGGGAVLRFAQTGFAAEGWEAEYDAYEAGWGMYFATLASYVEHFAGRPVRNAMSMGMVAPSPAAAWATFLPALGLDAMPAVGDEVTLTPDGPPAAHGVVDLVTPFFLGVRTADSLHRFGAEGGDDGCGVSGSHYFYGPAADGPAGGERTAGEPVPGGAGSPDATIDAWQAWITRHFPAPQHA